MSYPTLTPPRPLPGTYFQTPAVTNSHHGPLFQPKGAPVPAGQAPSPGSLTKLTPAAPKSKSETLSTRERAAQTINDTLVQESRYPDLDTYLSRMSIACACVDYAGETRHVLTGFLRGFLVRLRHSSIAIMGAFSQSQNV